MPIRTTGGGYPQYYGDSVGAPVLTAIDDSAYADTGVMILYQYTGGAWSAIYNLTALAATYLLLESGDKLLLENGDKIVLEA